MMPLFLAVSVPGFTALLSLAGSDWESRPAIAGTRSKLGEVHCLQIRQPGDSCLSLPFICSQAASISQVVQGLGVLSTWVHFQSPATRQPHPCCRGACAGRRKVRSQEIH